MLPCTSKSNSAFSTVAYREFEIHESNDARLRRGLCIALVAACGLAAAPAFSADTCDGFTWQVTQERAIFSGTPQSLPAGKEAAAAPQLEPGHLYELELLPQTDVTFAATSTKKMLTDGAHAGLALIDIPAAGRYRVSLDSETWIDVAEGDHLVPSRDFRGQRGCSTPHKIVEFDLPQAGRYALQFSMSTAPTLRVAVTPSPAN